MFIEQIRELSQSKIAMSIRLLQSLIDGDTVTMPPMPSRPDAHLAQVSLLVEFLELLQFRLEQHAARVTQSRNQPDAVSRREMERAENKLRAMYYGDDDFTKYKQEILEQSRKDIALAAARKQQRDALIEAHAETLRLSGMTIR